MPSDDWILDIGYGDSASASDASLQALETPIVLTGENQPQIQHSRLFILFAASQAEITFGTIVSPRIRISI